MRRDAFLVAVVLHGACLQVAAARHRFHLVSPSLEQRLSPAARANLAAVLRVGNGRGTGFLVDGVPGRDGTGLILTNHHVAAGTASGEALAFHDGSIAHVARVLASSPELDFALIEVKLPASSSARPVRLRAGPVGAAERVYAISGAANPFALQAPLPQTTVVRRGAVISEEARRTGVWTIQQAAESGGGMLRLTGSAQVLSLSFGLPNAPGASGSPIFSASDHDVVALHWGGNGGPSWRSSGTPAYAILDDLRRRALPETARLLGQAAH